MSTIERINSRIDALQLNYFGIMSVSLVAGTCFASGALIVILLNSAPIWQLALLTCVTMASNATGIAHSPIRWVVWMAGLNAFTSLFLILLNIF